MKNYKKGLLGITALVATLLMADTPTATITVNTFADDDDPNATTCSLRQAVKAASTHMSYAGCTPSTGTNTIQLQAGTYVLTKELQPTASMNILGADPTDYANINVLTNDYPAPTALKTTITGQGQTRLFNTNINNNPELALYNLVLDSGKATDRGGALYMGGALTLNNVTIQNSSAATGGAIFLSNANSNFTMTQGIIQNNNATDGSVLAMTCQDNLVFTPRSIIINNISVLNNGNANSNSTFAFCGEPTASISNATITQNTTNTNSGSILQFSSTSPQGAVNLSTVASLTLLNNTIVQNTAWTGLLYNNVGRKALGYNVLAYNTSGKSCRYADGDYAANTASNFTSFDWNALVLNSGTDQCELANSVLTSYKAKTIDLTGSAFSNVLSTLQTASAYTLFMPMYFPVDNGTVTDLVDVGTTQCSTNTDQRGISRAITGITTSASTANSCDIGSTQLVRLTAANLTGSNTDVVALLNSYQDNLTKFSGLVSNTATKPEFLPYYKEQVTKYTNLINFVKSKQKYRTYFADPFATSMPAEKVLSDNGRQIKYLSSDNYNVTTSVLGKGTINDSNVFVPSGTNADKDALHCDWDPDLKMIMVYRTDDQITATGDTLYCTYTLTLLDDNKQPTTTTSSAYIAASFNNIAPYSKDVSYTIQHGTLQSIDVNLLNNVNDDGDGNVAALTSNPNKKAYYTNDQGQDLAIRVDSVPDPVAVTGDRSGPCPGDDSKLNCIGGTIHITVKNTLDPFNYKFNYYVYDADGKPSATAGVVSLNNTASASNSTSSSGGGSFGVVSLLGIAGLLGYRRYKSK